MVISSYYDRADLDSLYGIVVHEMVHVWQDINETNHKDSHGYEFINKLKEIQKKVKFNIPLKDDGGIGISDKIKVKKFDVMIFKHKNNSSSCCVFKNGLIEKPLREYLDNGIDSNEVEDIVYRYDHMVLNCSIIYYLKSDNKELLMFPTSMKLRTAKFYSMDSKKVDEIIAGGDIILKLDMLKLKELSLKTKDHEFIAKRIDDIINGL